jgi:drug/metabolite transporter (DMT)-like permease
LTSGLRGPPLQALKSFFYEGSADHYGAFITKKWYSPALFMVSGIWLALLGGVILAVADAFKKRLAERFANEVVIWNAVAWGVALTGAFIAITGIGPVDWSVVWRYLPLALLLFLIGEITFIRSLKSGEFSEVIPFKATVPIVGMALSFFLLGEVPTVIALTGVALVVIGIYLMYLPNLQLKSILRPLQACWENPGPRYMIASSVVGAGFGVVIKSASNGCPPIFFFWLVLLGELLCFSVYLAVQRRSPLGIYKTAAIPTLLMSVPWSAGIVLLNISVSYTLVAYAHAAGQVHAIAALLLAYFFFGERNMIKRIVPCLVMVAGVCCIVLG